MANNMNVYNKNGLTSEYADISMGENDFAEKYSAKRKISVVNSDLISSPLDMEDNENDFSDAEPHRKVIKTSRVQTPQSEKRVRRMTATPGTSKEPETQKGLFTSQQCESPIESLKRQGRFESLTSKTVQGKLITRQDRNCNKNVLSMSFNSYSGVSCI